MFVLVSYDVVADRRRAKVHKAMQDYGTRVQYSVFECNLEAAALEKLRARLKSLINPKEDSVRFYVLCQSDVRKVKLLGQGKVTRLEPYRLV
jgi:CRISPR-associated protein Cas2